MKAKIKLLFPILCMIASLWVESFINNTAFYERHLVACSATFAGVFVYGCVLLAIELVNQICNTKEKK